MTGSERMPARLRDRIFDAVLAELVESGVDEFSVASVARRTGIAQQVIDRHWPDGRVLLMEAMLAHARKAVPIPDDGSLMRDLRQFARSLAALTGTTFGRQWFRRLVPGGRDADLSNVGPDFWAFQMAAVEQMFRQAAERGELRADIDEGLAARMLAAALTYDMVYNDSATNPVYAEQVCSIFLNGTLRSENSGLLEDFHQNEQTRAVLRATFDGIIDPIALLEAVRDDDGHIIDFIFREANPAACTYLQNSRTELLGATLTETLPELVGSRLFARYVHAMETGEPLEVEDFRFFSRRFHTMRRFDLRGMPASRDWLAMIWRDVSERHRTHQQAVVNERLIAAREARARASPDALAEIAEAEVAQVAADALLDPQVLLEPARDPSGQIVDFVYRAVNQATCDYLGLSREDLLGRGVVETMPGLKGKLLQDYIRCLETGEPLILNDFAYDNEILQDTRRYDLRVTRASSSSLTLTWRDVTERFQAAQELARSRDLLRASSDAMFNPQALVELTTTPTGQADLVLRDVNHAFCDYIDQERTGLVGQSLLALFPNVISSGLMTHYVRCAETGEPVILDDVAYFTEFINEPRRFDIRAAQVDIGLIALSIRDTTARFEAAIRLADSEQQYRLLAENTSDVITRVRDGRFIWVSPAVKELLGAPAEYWIGRELREIIPTEDIPAFKERMAILQAGGTIQRRIRMNDVDGVTHWIHVHAKPFYDASGHQDGFTGSLRSIDEEVAAETAADEARRRQARADALYRRSMDNAAIGMCLTSPDGRLVEVNDALCRFFGYDADTLTTKTWQELTAPEYLAEDLNKADDIRAGRLESFRTVKQYINADGRLIWGDLSVSCLRDEHGLVECFVSQITDITARVEADEWNRHLAQELQRQNKRLLDSEATYRLLAENTHDLVAHVRDGEVVWTSPSAEEMLGAPPEYWIGRKAWEIVPPEDRSAFADRLAILAEGGVVQERVPVVSATGVSHCMHLHAAPFYDDDGQRDGFIAALRNIDNEVAAEAAAREAQRQQAESDALYRESISSANVGMGISQPDGTFITVNPALCEMLGYDAETLKTKTWIELTAPAFLAENLANRDDIVAGRVDSYRMIKQFIHADGHLVWCDLSVGCVRNPDGTIRALVYHIIDITARVEAEQRIAESEERYRLLAENTTDAIIHGHKGKFVWVSPAIESVLGAPPAYWIGRDLSEILPPSDRDAFAERLKALEAGSTIQRRSQVVAVDGITHWVHIHAAPYYDTDGRQVGFTSALRCIDDEVAAEDAAQQARRQQSRANALYRRSMESAAVGMCLARPEGPLVEVNDALCEFFGYDAETMLRKTWIELTVPDYLQADLDHVADLVAGRSDSYRMIKQYVHADGHRLWGDLSVGCLRRDDGSVEVLIKQVTDITAQVQAEEQLERLARVDTLTGLANRGEAIARMEAALEPTGGGQTHLGVLFADIDGFKAINDKLGHAAGDTVLSTLASRIRHCVRDGDTVGRMGGDEILILLPDMPSIDQVTRVAEKIRRHAAEPLRIGGQAITVTLSIGAVLAAPGQTTSVVLARADSAMYAAKAQKNAVASFPSGEPS